MNMKQTTLITIIMVALVFTGCKSDSDPKCDCPNGTVHLVGDNTCCNYDDCVCEKDVVGKTVYGIPVTNRENVANFDAVEGYIKGTFDMLEGIKPGVTGTFKNYCKEIEVSDTQPTAAGLTNGKLTINKDTSEAETQDLLYNLLVDLGLVSRQ